MRRAPVPLLVDETLVVRGDNEGAVGQGHVRDAVSEVQLLLGLVQDVVHHDHVVLVERHVRVLPGEGPVHEAHEDHRPAAAAAGELGAVIAPGDGKDRTDVRRLAAVGPARAVAELQRVVGAHGEVPASGRPRERRDHMVHGRAAEEQPAIRVPDLVLAVLAARENCVVHKGPVDHQHNAVVALPFDLLLAGLDGLEVDLVLAGEEQVLRVRGPDHGVDGVRHLREGRPQHAAAGPDLHRAVLAC
mmetsp:Transcript_31829/g.91346  ORF Transcript_31829/g.91346 Transcript_31829/m.91346 type:complete len:245 (+) Transcript_31829:1244-1978(+)